MPGMVAHPPDGVSSAGGLQICGIPTVYSAISWTQGEASLPLTTIVNEHRLACINMNLIDIRNKSRRLVSKSAHWL